MRDDVTICFQSDLCFNRPIYIISWFLLIVFQIQVPLAKNIGTIMAARFLQGVLGSAPGANTRGTIYDL